MKDAVRLGSYFLALILLAAILAPILFWGAQFLARQGIFSSLASFDFETFFHRALLLAAAILIWPLFRLIQVRRLRELGLRPRRNPGGVVLIGFIAAFVPLVCCGAILVAEHVYSLRAHVSWSGIANTLVATVAVPLIEETFFRGLVLGILLRNAGKNVSVLITSALFAIVHFLKAPEQTSPTVTWLSGFNSIANSFAQFRQPMLVLTGFTTLFLIGWILADARIRTHSLWLPIGLHAGWICGSGLFNKVAHRQMLLLPWLGNNLLVGIIPLGVASATWLIILLWLRPQIDDQ